MQVIKKWSEMTIMEKLEYASSVDKFLPLMLYVSLGLVVGEIWGIISNPYDVMDIFGINWHFWNILQIAPFSILLYFGNMLYKSFLQEYRFKENANEHIRMNKNIEKTIEAIPTKKPEKEIKAAVQAILKDDSGVMDLLKKIAETRKDKPPLDGESDG